MAKNPDVAAGIDAVARSLNGGGAAPLLAANGGIGPVSLPGTGRMVWWTGRVAIGLRHQPIRSYGPVTQSELWLQGLLLNGVGEQPTGT